MDECKLGTGMNDCYRGVRWSQELGGGTTVLDPRGRHLLGEPDSNFDWGNHSKGSQDLSRELLIDCLGDRNRAVCLAQEFLEKFVSKFPIFGWMFSKTQITTMISEIEA